MENTNVFMDTNSPVAQHIKETAYLRAVQFTNVDNIYKMTAYSRLKEYADGLGLQEALHGNIGSNRYVVYNLTGDPEGDIRIYAEYEWEGSTAGKIIKLSIEGREYDMNAIRTKTKPEVPHREELPSGGKKDELQEQITRGIQSFMNSDKFRNWLKTSGRIFTNNYSFRNALLVWLQKEDPSYVMGFEAWKEFGRTVTRGAVGARIFVPVKARENEKGGLFSMCNRIMDAALAADASLQQAYYRLGESRIEFTKTRSGIYGYKINGQEKGIFSSSEEFKRFIDHNILQKVIVGFKVGIVFDIKDVAVPEYLWLKRGFTKDEVVYDSKGDPVINRKGEYKIINTPERQGRLVTTLETSMAEQDPEKMTVLLDALKSVCSRKGIKVSENTEADDNIIGEGAGGYYHYPDMENKEGYIVIDGNLGNTEKVAVLFHEMAHSDLHRDIKKLAADMGEERIPGGMREVQAEATAYMTAQVYGIETETRSFAYIANWADGYELQALQKSFELIYKESRELLQDIDTELDLMGYRIDLSKKEDIILTIDTVKTISDKYTALYNDNLRAMERVEKQLAVELPGIIKETGTNTADKINALSAQVSNISRQKEILGCLKAGINLFSSSTLRSEQDMHLQSMETIKTRLREERDNNLIEDAPLDNETINTVSNTHGLDKRMEDWKQETKERRNKKKNDKEQEITKAKAGRQV